MALGSRSVAKRHKCWGDSFDIMCASIFGAHAAVDSVSLSSIKIDPSLASGGLGERFSSVLRKSTFTRPRSVHSANVMQRFCFGEYYRMNVF